jgi:hypothetical protein
MKIFYIILIAIISIKTYSQCKKEIIKNSDFYYEGCLNFEGKPDGEGVKKVELKGDVITYIGDFKSGQFKNGDYTCKFKNGDEKFIKYIDFENKIIDFEIYTWKSGAIEKTIYNSGKISKQILTKGKGDDEGLIIEKLYVDDKIIETSNITNNRVSEDIVGNEEFIDVNLIDEKNQFKIPIEFPTIKGDSFTVPIHFDTGASDFLIGSKLYNELLSKCDVIDLNVKKIINGVGSKFSVKYILIKKIKIGNYSINNVVAFVPIGKDKNGNEINDMLIGIGFLKKFKDVTWSLNNNVLRFFK